MSLITATRLVDSIPARVRRAAPLWARWQAGRCVAYGSAPKSHGRRFLGLVWRLPVGTAAPLPNRGKPPGPVPDFPTILRGRKSRTEGVTMARPLNLQSR